MIKFKALQYNKKGKLMFIFFICTNFIIFLLGFLMLMSRNVRSFVDSLQQAVNTEKKISYNGEQLDITTYFHNFLYEGIWHNQVFYFLIPNIAWIIYIPIIFGGLFFLFLLFSFIVLSFNIKLKNLKNILSVNKPLKIYVIYYWIIILIFCIDMLVITMFYLDASSILNNKMINFNFTKLSLSACDIIIPNKSKDYFTNYFNHNDILWFSYLIFSKNILINNYAIVYIVTLLTNFLIFCLDIVGIVLGGLGWKRVALFSLANNGDSHSLLRVLPKIKENEKIILLKRYKSKLQNENKFLSENSELFRYDLSKLSDHDDALLVNDNTLITSNLTNFEKTSDQSKTKAIEKKDIMLKLPDFDSKGEKRKAKLELKKEQKEQKEQKRQEKIELRRQALVDKKEKRDKKRFEKNKYNFNRGVIDENDFDYDFDESLIEHQKNGYISFINNTMLLMDKVGYIDKELYSKLNFAKDGLRTKKANSYLKNIAFAVNNLFTYFTKFDVKLIAIVKETINQNVNYFDKNKELIKELIRKYEINYSDKNIYKCELFINEINTILIRYSNFLPKVGVTLKYKLVNIYTELDLTKNYLEKLHNAKLKYNYDLYRQICFEIIRDIAPEKNNIRNIVKNIYN